MLAMKHGYHNVKVKEYKEYKECNEYKE